MNGSTVPEGVEVRRFTRRDGTVTEVFSVRVTDIDGTRRRRSFDSLEDALDYRARLRSARRSRPEELRQEQAGTQTLGAFFEQSGLPGVTWTSAPASASSNASGALL